MTDVKRDDMAASCEACGADLLAEGAVAGRLSMDCTGRFRADGAGLAFVRATEQSVLSGQMGPTWNCRACGAYLRPAGLVTLDPAGT